MKSEDSMTTDTRRSYTETFKEEAVRLVRESGHPVAQVARDLGIADHLLHRLPMASGAAAGRGAWADSAIPPGWAGRTGPAAA